METEKQKRYKIIAIKTFHKREPSINKWLNAFLIAVVIYKIVLQITVRIAAFMLLLCRLFISFVILVVTHNWNATFITYYLSEFPIKIIMTLSSPMESLTEYIVRNMELPQIKNDIYPTKMTKHK